MRLLLAAGLVALAGCASSAPTAPAGPATSPASPPLSACTDGRATGPDGTVYTCSGVDLLAHLPLAEMGAAGSGNDIWGWTDPTTGREYAIVGLNDGTFFVDVTNPTAIVPLGKLPTATAPSVWRDIKVYRDHAFIVSEAPGHGMQVFSLARLRGLTADPARRFEADARYAGIGNAHNIVINEATGFAYANGASTTMGDRPDACAAPGFHVINIQTPLEPSFAGCFSDASKDGSPVTAPGYTHDGQCVVYAGPDADYTGREICLAANEDVVSIFDATDKANVRLVAQAAYPNDAYTHQVWFTEDQRHALANDELDEMNGLTESQRTLVFDLSDLDAPEFDFAFDSGITTIDHNLYIHNGLAYMSNYESGLRVVDVRVITEEAMREVASFDTFPRTTTAQFNGQWSNYPYFRSGTIIANDINNGLFVLRVQPGAVPGIPTHRP